MYIFVLWKTVQSPTVLHNRMLHIYIYMYIPDPHIFFLMYMITHVTPQVLVKHGALVAMSNKYGDTPLSKSRPRLRKKLEGAVYMYTFKFCSLLLNCLGIRISQLSLPWWLVSRAPDKKSGVCVFNLSESHRYLCLLFYISCLPLH